MAPREIQKPTAKVQRGTPKASIQRRKSAVAGIKKSLTTKNTTDEVIKEAKVNTTATQPRASIVSKMSTPKAKEKMSVPLPGSITKSVKKDNWKRKPKPAHSGVPVPEKLRKLLEKNFQNLDCSL